MSCTSWARRKLRSLIIGPARLISAKSQEPRQLIAGKLVVVPTLLASHNSHLTHARNLSSFAPVLLLFSLPNPLAMLHATWNAICDGDSLSWCGLRAHCGRRFTIYKVHKASKKKREKSSAKKERKATKTLAIVLGKSRLTKPKKPKKKQKRNSKLHIVVSKCDNF